MKIAVSPANGRISPPSPAALPVAAACWRRAEDRGLRIAGPGVDAGATCTISGGDTFYASARCTDDGTWVAVGGQGMLATSPDAVTWTEQPRPTDQQLRDLAESPGRPLNQVQRALFEAHSELLEDDELIRDAEASVDAGRSAPVRFSTGR